MAAFKKKNTCHLSLKPKDIKNWERNYYNNPVEREYYILHVIDNWHTYL